MSTKPITPAEAKAKRSYTIPDFVVDAFNEMIMASWKNANDVEGRAYFVLSDVINRIILKRPDVCINDIRENGWDRVESLYLAQGWTNVFVNHDSSVNEALCKFVYKDPAYFAGR
jgi:hypothetical protein